MRTGAKKPKQFCSTGVVGGSRVLWRFETRFLIHIAIDNRFALVAAQTCREILLQVFCGGLLIEFLGPTTTLLLLHRYAGIIVTLSPQRSASSDNERCGHPAASVGVSSFSPDT